MGNQKALSDWVRQMRELGVQEVWLHPNGSPSRIVLGPVPEEPAISPSEPPKPPKPPSTEERLFGARSR